MKPVIGRGIDTVIHYHIVEQWVTHFLLLLQKTGILYFGRYIHWLTWCYQKPHTLHLIPHCITTTFNYYPSILLKAPLMKKFIRVESLQVMNTSWKWVTVVGVYGTYGRDFNERHREHWSVDTTHPEWNLT